MEPMTHNLCGECWSITPMQDWKGFNWDDEHENLVPSGDDPTFYRCPACLTDHSDDDSSPGVWDGSLAEMRQVRAEENRGATDG